MENKDILDTVAGGIPIRDMSAITFVNWVSSKIDGMPAYKAATTELAALVAQPPMSRIMPDEEKCRIVRRLLELGVTL